MIIFPEIPLSKTEEDIIFKALHEPAVQKYLHVLANRIGRSIVLSTPKDGESDEQFLRKKAHAQGQLAVLETLLQTGTQEVEQTPVNS